MPTKIMTFNIRTTTFLDWFSRGWNTRKSIAVNLIKDSDPDIFGLQECKPKQLSYINSSLPGYLLALKSTVSRDGGSGEKCPIFYKNGFIEEDSGVFSLSEDPSKIGKRSWGAMFPRICTWVRLHSTETGTFFVFNAHLDNFSESARFNSVKLIIDKIGPITWGHPVILIGDFNDTPDSRAVKAVEDASILFATDQSLFKEYTKHPFNGKATKTIDYIFPDATSIMQSYQVLKYNENGVYPSDHFPVMANITI